MIKTGILGTSETANLYAKLLIGLEGFELTGCFSPDYNKTKSFAAQYNLVAYPSSEALFKYTEALIITEFTPDFLANSEKAIKNFKHILITNPFLAGFEEIQHLRKLSEESGVLMQIAGGFKYPEIVSSFEKTGCYLADLRHSFGCCNALWYGSKFAEHLLADISLMLMLLKGVTKKSCISAWEKDEKENGLVSVRLELDNGSVANLLINLLEEKNSFDLNIYSNKGVTTFQDDFPKNGTSELSEETVRHELTHFEKSIQHCHYPTAHCDIMFQALELAHRIKSKTVQNFAVNFPN